MNMLFLITFGITLFQPPSMIYRFAIIQDKTIPNSTGEKKIAVYCRKVTVVWTAFFILNGSMAGWTILSGSNMFWSVYNGGISYILIGVLFAGEYMVRKKVQKNIPKAIPLTKINKKSREHSAILCYEGGWKDGKYKTWKDFLEETAKLRRQIKTIDSERWLLHCEDCWLFLLAFTSLLQCKKEILLSANVNPAYIAEIRDANGTVTFLSDQVFSETEKPSGFIYIPDMLKTSYTDSEELPPVNGDETSIVMFTSGSTGKPKAIQQRLSEFENDNHFILSKWGEEFVDRKLCSTVNQHHIYGLLYSILLPFTAGIPFRRERIQIPEELKKLSDTKYLIITVPSFLKRAVEIETNLRLSSPWIFSSGGVLAMETAEKTAEVFGSWPVEVYGSTETSGIAWRQSGKGPEWTAFDNARLTGNKDGCLVVRSPYIKDPAGFETADVVEFLKDGRFLLKERIDSVVKIEEKRISLLEVEERILQSGLAANVSVIPMKDSRQYLAAAVVLNDKGKSRFSGFEKYAINKYWRDYLAQYIESLVIPKKWRYPHALQTDSQGKIKREDVKKLFVDEKFDFGKVTERTEKSVTLEFSVSGSSPYFDGHFSEFKILPAVAQIELITRFASEYFGTDIAVSEIRRVKFTNFIRPSASLGLRLEKGEKNISFIIYCPESKSVYSKGNLIVLPKQPPEEDR
jgi:acyl-coenzyme A synthetase/AMP-(fatty) acid ligase